MLREAGYYARLVLGTYKLMRTPPVTDPEAALRRQLENREKNFLEAVRGVVFANPKNPYHQMFRLAGCSWEDLERSVNRDGLEATLASIHRQGVYLTHDEFKGKTSIFRSGRSIHLNERSLANPLVSGLLVTTSSGSRSRGTITGESIENRVYREIYYTLVNREFDLDSRLFVAVEAILPSQTGLSSCLKTSRVGTRLDRWFSVGGRLRESLHYRAATSAFVFWGNLLGANGRYPRYLPPNDFSPVAEWLAWRRSTSAGCVVECGVSFGVRIAVAALERGLDIRGTIFLVGGEALTDPKRAAIEAAGAEVYPNYWTTEVGPIGYACRQMKAGNCVHLFQDSIAAISARRLEPLSGVEVDSLLLTSLLPSAPRVLINVEMGDSGTLGRARCDCSFSMLGLNSEIRDIASYGKLTGLGMTLVGTDMLRLLEETLPARLGGSPGDYQLVERDQGRQTRLQLRVSRRVRLRSVDEVRELLLTEIRKYFGGALAARVWRHAEAVEVVQDEPFSTSTGKVLPLHLLGSSGRQRKPSEDSALRLS